MTNRILPTFSIFVALGILFVYVGPTWTGSIAATKLAIASANQALAAAQTYADQESQLAAERDKIDPADLERLDAFLPSSVDNVGLVLDLNALAARSGLTLSNIDVATDRTSESSNSTRGLPTSGTNPIGSVNLSLSAIGTYSALKAFLSGVEKSERLLDVQDLTVSGSNTGVYTYRMTLRIYWLR